MKHLLPIFFAIVYFLYPSILPGQNIVLVGTLKGVATSENTSEESTDQSSIHILHLGSDYLTVYNAEALITDTIHFGGTITQFMELRQVKALAIIGFDEKDHAVAKIYDYNSGSVRTILSIKDPIFATAYNGNDKFAIANSKGEIFIFSGDNWNKPKSYNAGGVAIEALRFSDNVRLLFGNDNGDCGSIDLASGKIRSVHANDSYIFSIRSVGDIDCFLSNNNVTVLKDGNVDTILRSPGAVLGGMELDQENQSLIVVTERQEIYVYELKDYSLASCINKQPEIVLPPRDTASYHSKLEKLLPDGQPPFTVNTARSVTQIECIDEKNANYIVGGDSDGKIFCWSEDLNLQKSEQIVYAPVVLLSVSGGQGRMVVLSKEGELAGVKMPQLFNYDYSSNYASVKRLSFSFNENKVFMVTPQNQNFWYDRIISFDFDAISKGRNPTAECMDTTMTIKKIYAVDGARLFYLPEYHQVSVLNVKTSRSEKLMDSILMDFAVSRSAPEQIFYISEYLFLCNYQLKTGEVHLILQIPRRHYTDYDVFRVECSENNKFVALQVANDLKLINTETNAVVNEILIPAELKINDFAVLNTGALIYSVSLPLKSPAASAEKSSATDPNIRVSKTFLDPAAHLLYITLNVGTTLIYSL